MIYVSASNLGLIRLFFRKTFNQIYVTVLPFSGIENTSSLQTDQIEYRKTLLLQVRARLNQRRVYASCRECFRHVSLQVFIFILIHSKHLMAQLQPLQTPLHAPRVVVGQHRFAARIILNENM